VVKIVFYQEKGYGGFNTDSSALEKCILGVSLKANNNIMILKTELTCNLAHNVHMDVCVLRNFQWFLFSIMSVTVLYLGGRFFRDTV